VPYNTGMGEEKRARRRAPPPEPAPRKKPPSVLLALIGGAALFLVVIVVALAMGGPGPKPAKTTELPPAPATTAAPPPPRPKTLEQRLEEAAERDRELDKKYRTRHRMWTALLADAKDTRHEDAVREHLEKIESAANKAYRELARPMREEVRALAPPQARAKLAEWKIPEELDVTGALAAEHAKEIESYDQLAALAAARAKLDDSADPEPALAGFLRSEHVAVRTAAGWAVAELRVAWRMRLLGEKMASRRAAALARIDAVRGEIKRDDAAARERLAAWERRLKAAKPFSLKPWGFDLERDVRVAKFDARMVTFATEGIELGFGLDELHPLLLGHLLQLAADPKSGRDLFEAGKLAVRRDALDAAAKLFEQASQADRALAPLAPDVARIRRGIASLSGDVSVAGATLKVRYTGRDGESKDFVASPGAKLSTAGEFAVSGSGLFYEVPKDLQFEGSLRLTWDGLRGNDSYAVGAMLEPSGETVLVEWEVNGRWRVQLLHPDRQPRVLTEGEGQKLVAEVHFESPRVVVSASKSWTGDVGSFRRIRPFVGGLSYEGRAGGAAYRWFAFEGRVGGQWIQRLRAERSAILEAELAKEARTTSEERAAAELVGARSFGESPFSPLPLEKELASIQPPKVGEYFAQVRQAHAMAATLKDAELYWATVGRTEEWLTQAVSEAPWYPLTWYYRAEWRDLRNDVAGALADLGEAAKRAPSFVEARLARARLLLEFNRHAEAAKELDAALEAVPDLARARQSRALLHYYAGRKEQAVAEVELAMRLEPSDLALRRTAKRLRAVVAGPLWSDSAAVETKSYTIRAEVPKAAKKGQQALAAQKVKERIERFAAHLEAARAYFGTLVPGKPESVMKPVVYFFASAESYYVYADFTQEDRMEHTAGVFLPAYRQMLFFDEATEEGTLETMAHEAFHEYVMAIAPHVPVWLNEGMAEYCAGIDVRGGSVRLIPGRLRVMKQALAEGFGGIPFEVMMRESVAQFYTVMRDIQYAQAWSMVHFFRHGADRAYAGVLEKYVKLITDGKTGDEAFRETFGKHDLAALRAEWREYVKGLR